MPISYNLSLTTDLSRPSLSRPSLSRPSTHPPCHYHNPLGAPGTRTLKIHRETPPMGAAACLHSPSGRQQIALSDGFLDAKNPDPTTRVPNMPLKRRDAKLFTLC